MLRCPLRIGHELGAETLVIGDRLLGKCARFELALAEQYRNLGHWKGKRVSHRYLTLIRHSHSKDDQRGDLSIFDEIIRVSVGISGGVENIKIDKSLILLVGLPGLEPGIRPLCAARPHLTLTLTFPIPSS